MSQHADLATLLAYRQGELGEAQESAFEEHYFGCDLCSARLTEIEVIARGVQGAFASGLIGAFVTPAFVERLRSAGAQVREYRIRHNGSVNCTVAPGDQFLLSRLEVPLEGVERVDAIAVYEGEQRIEDIPFDVAVEEVVLVPSIAFVRTLPAHRQSVRLVAVTAQGDRPLGQYVFNHSPHEE